MNVMRRATKYKTGKTRSEGRTKRIITATSQIVKEAAELLDEEMAAGIVAANKMQERFRKERRIDQSDFKNTLKRFQAASHELVNAMDDQVTGLSDQANSELIKRFSKNTHDLLDLVVSMVTISATIADEVVQLIGKKQVRDNKGRG